MLPQKLTLNEQIAAMEAHWPQFRLVSRSPCTALWEGPLAPLNKGYTIQVLYSQVEFPCAGILKHVPNIEVVNPLLQRREEEPNTPIPHIYSNDVLPERPYLCLYQRGEWTPYQPISDCVPWTTEWLACYEGWLATGDWRGGGHGTERNRHERRRRQRLRNKHRL